VCTARYDVIDLGTLGGFTSAANDINDAGDIVGVADTTGEGGRIPRAVLWRGGAKIELGTLGGGTSRANAINEAGQIVGEADTPTRQTAALWDGGTVVDLTPSVCRSEGAFAINDAGQVAGSFNTACSGTAAWPERAFVWRAGILTEIRDLFRPSGIDSDGRVVGTSFDPAVPGSRALLITAGSVIDLGTLAGPAFPNFTSQAHAITAGGEVVGSSDTSVLAEHAFRWVDGVMTDLAPAARWSRAFGVNDEGDAVGVAADGSAALFRADTVTNLQQEIPPDSQWQLAEARAINAHGQIVGVGTMGGLPFRRAFLLQPRPTR
jgi:probable HAF family extracellular repeat protein